MANEWQTNLDLISVLLVSSSQPSFTGNLSLVSAILACNNQPSSNALIVQPPFGVAVATGVTLDPTSHATCVTVA